ncbi:MAG: helix-turn-helix transcriptional regulator [Nonlabens sp.]|uniref:helix-turn-helix transcriptional regulator n=2 Tax=Nonlabens sp. TaxID=1888209 RepID=UPI0032191689
MAIDLIYFLSISLSLLTGVYILIKIKPKYHSAPLYYLSTYYVLNAFCFSFYLLIKYEWIIHVSYLYKFTAPFTYLILPFSYFHIRALLKNKVGLNLKDAIHFIPFVLFLISYSEFYFMPFDEKQAYVSLLSEKFELTYTDNVGLIPEAINSMGRVIQPFVYLILQWLLIKKFKHFKNHRKRSKIYKWTKQLTLLQTIYSLLLLLTMVLVFVFSKFFDNTIFPQVSAVLTASFFFYISVYLFWHSDILNYLKNFKISKASKKTSNKLLEITQYVIDKQLFLKQDLSLNDLADSLEINQRELFEFLKEHNLSYNKWINEIRINHSLTLIKSGYLDQYSVEALASKCGFKSKSTFYRAFKENTHKTPVELRASLT